MGGNQLKITTSVFLFTLHMHFFNVFVSLLQIYLGFSEPKKSSQSLLKISMPSGYTANKILVTDSTVPLLYCWCGNHSKMRKQRN